MLSLYAATAVLLAGNVLGQSFVVHTPPSATECQPLAITWTGGTQPYSLSILPGNGIPPSLITFGGLNGHSFSWVANVTAGTTLSFDLRDSHGTLTESGPFTVRSGNDTSCLASSGTTTGITSSTSVTGTSLPTTTGNITVSTNTTGTGTVSHSTSAISITSSTSAAPVVTLSNPSTAVLSTETATTPTALSTDTLLNPTSTSPLTTTTPTGISTPATAGASTTSPPAATTTSGATRNMVNACGLVGAALIALAIL